MDGVAGSRAGAEWWRPGSSAGPFRVQRVDAEAKDSPIPFAALLLFLVLLLLAPQAFVPGVGRVRIALLTGAFAIASQCWTRFVAKRPLMRWTREMSLVTALLGWAVVTLPLSVWPDGAATILRDDYLKALALFWLLSNTITTLPRLRLVAWTLSLAAAPIAATGMWNFFTGVEFSGRVVGYQSPLVVNPNNLALVLNLILPLTVALFLSGRRPAARGLLAGLMALNVGAIIVSFSRGGFLTLATTFILYLRTFHARRQWKWVAAALMLVIAAAPLLPSGYLERLSTITNIHADETGSSQERWEDSLVAFGYALTHPLVGDGLGMNVIQLCIIREWSSNCIEACLNYRPPFPNCLFVHNMYLAYAMDLGWPGLALFLLLLVSGIKGAARVRARSAGLPALRDLSVLAEGIRITLIALAVAALFHPNAYEVYAYFAIALAVAVGGVYEAEARLRATGTSASTPP